MDNSKDVCFLCNCAFTGEENSWMIFNTHLLIDNHLQRSVSSILSSALGREVNENTIHSTLLCQDCKKLVFEYAFLEHRFNDLRYQILTTYNSTAEFYNMSPIVFNIDTVVEKVDDETMQVPNFEETAVTLSTEYFSDIKSDCEAIDVLAEDGEPIIYCSEEEEDYSELKLAVIDIEQQTFKCEQCDKYFSTKFTLKHHMKLHDKRERRFQCDVCEKTFIKGANLRLHKERHKDMSERERRFQCNICNKWFLQKKNLQQHIKRHAESPKTENVKSRKIYKCDKCDRSYTSIYKLRYHIEAHNGRERRFECEICHKKFYANQFLKQHRLVHTDAKPFQCDTCGESFKTEQNLKNHIPIHTNPHAFKCRKCDKGFTRQSYLKIHERNHAIKYPFQCKICKAVFEKRADLVHHKKKEHFREISFKCEDCGRMFTGRQYLKLHKCAAKSPQKKKSKTEQKKKKIEN